MDIDPKGQPIPSQPLSETSGAPCNTDEETATALNRQLKKPPETKQSETKVPTTLSPQDSPSIEARLVASCSVSSGPQHEAVAQFMDFIREQGERCLRPDVDALMNRLFEWFKPELSIHDELTDSALERFIEQSPEHARALLFLAATMLQDDEEKALRLVTKVVQLAPEAISKLLFRWQTIQGVVNAGSVENVNMLRVFEDCMRLASQDDYMGVWLLHLIKQGLVKGIDCPVQPDELKDSNRQFTLISRVYRGAYLDEKRTIIEDKPVACILLMMCDPLSFGLLDRLPKLKEPASELIQITRNISSDSDDQFRYLLLPWFITKCSSVLSELNGYDSSFQFFVSQLGGGCTATDLIKPLWGACEVLLLEITASMIRRGYAEGSIKAIEERAKVKPKNISARVHELRTKRLIAAERKRINESETVYGPQRLKKVKALNQLLTQRLASETSFSPFYQGLLWYYKGLIHEMQPFPDIFPGQQAPSCYLEAATQSAEDFCTLFHTAADLHCSQGNYAAAADAISGAVDFYRTFPPNRALAIAEASLHAYQAKAEEIKTLQTLPSISPEVAARLNAQGIDSDWLPEGQLKSTKESVKTKKKNKKKSQRPRRSQQPASTAESPSATSLTEEPPSGSHGRSLSVSRQLTEKKAGKVSEHLAELLPQYWPDEIHREMKKITMSLYDPFEELEVLENLQNKYDKKAGIERIYEESAWVLIRIQKQPDLVRDYMGHDDYARASREILDEAEAFLNRALCRKLGVGLSALPKTPADCTTLADQRASLFNNEKDRTSYLTGFSCIMQSLGHVRYQREEVVSRGGRQAVQFSTRASYGQKISLRSRGNPK